MPVYLIPLKEQPKYVDNQKKLEKKAKEISNVMDGIVKIYSNEPSRGSWAIEKMDEMISAAEELSENEERAKFILKRVQAAKENELVEFKYSFITDYNKDNKNTEARPLPRSQLKDKILIAINSMLNSAGGNIIIGVADRETIKKHGINEHLKKVLSKKEINENKPLYIVGVEPDLKVYQNEKVTYRETLDEAIKTNFESTFRTDKYITGKDLVEVDGKYCFLLEIESYYEAHQKKKIVHWKDPDRPPYYRKGHESLKLVGKTHTDWIDN